MRQEYTQPTVSGEIVVFETMKVLPLLTSTNAIDPSAMLSTRLPLKSSSRRLRTGVQKVYSAERALPNAKIKSSKYSVFPMAVSTSNAMLII